MAEANHYSHMPTVKMLSLGGERLTPTTPYPPHTKKEENKSLGSLPAPQSGYAAAIMVFLFAHLHILEYSDDHQKFNQFFIVLPRIPP